MVSSHKQQSFVLLVGDLVFLVLSLWLALFIRFGIVPATDVFIEHLIPFSFLFASSIFSFFVAGLYEKQVVKVRRKIPELLFSSVIANAIVGISLFYFISFFEVTPKLVLFLYIGISFLLLFIWRTISVGIFIKKKKYTALMLGSGASVDELVEEVNGSGRYPFVFLHTTSGGVTKKYNTPEDVVGIITKEKISLVVIDSTDESLSLVLTKLHELLLLKIPFLEVRELYERIFDRVPLPLIKDDWLLEHVSLYPHALYDGAKRAMDILIALPLFLLSLPFYPLVWLAGLFEGSGKLFSVQERVGQFGKTIQMVKFRTMLFDDNGVWNGEKKNEVTKVGRILRKTRLDEIPQFINILKGELSLIGPRPEFPKAVSEYAKQIPYYNMRHMIKPGLSGWAQIYHENHPHHGMDIKETGNKLSYDIFYIKNRSIMLDVVIAAKTIKTLLSRQGK